VSTQPKTFITPEQYLELERAAEFKSEYYDGEMFAMAGGRAGHNLIIGNVIGSLYQQFRSQPCRVYPSDMRTRVGSNRRYAYPDVVVVCGEPVYLDEVQDALLNPTLSVEVLSPSTEKFDRGRKLAYYRSIESLTII
jgi:Uma2 family endonuclease